MNPSSASPAAVPTTHPPAFWFIFWGEFAERCSYYGMRAILPLYLTQVLHFSATDAGPIYFGFKMAVYLLPLLGGFLADRYFGKYWTLVGFSVPYVMGHFILGIESTTALFIALSLLALGSGVIKPNIPTLLGSDLRPAAPGPGAAALRRVSLVLFFRQCRGSHLHLHAAAHPRQFQLSGCLSVSRLADGRRPGRLCLRQAVLCRRNAWPSPIHAPTSAGNNGKRCPLWPACFC